jgi:hypothetical protein
MSNRMSNRMSATVAGHAALPARIADHGTPNPSRRAAGRGTA